MTNKARKNTWTGSGERSLTLIPSLSASITSGGGGNEPNMAGNNKPTPNTTAITLSAIANTRLIITLHGNLTFLNKRRGTRSLGLVCYVCTLLASVQFFKIGERQTQEPKSHIQSEQCHKGLLVLVWLCQHIHQNVYFSKLVVRTSLLYW